MDSQIFLTPSENANILKNNSDEKSFAEYIYVLTQGQEIDLSEFNLAFFGVKEDRVSENEGCALGVDKIREQLYKLYPSSFEPKIIDLGDVVMGDSVSDTYHAVTSIIKDCLKNKVIPLIIGGSQDLVYANYKAYEELEQTVNITTVDSRFDLGSSDDEPLTDNNFVRKIVLSENNYLFNYSAIGYQTYLIKNSDEKLMQDMYFDTFRLGQIQQDISLAEPIVRFSDILNVDMSSIRFSDFEAHVSSNSNGFYGEEVCQIMRYAGISDKLTSIGIYQYNPLFDRRDNGAQLIAQMIWCFIDGYYNRMCDNPLLDKANYQKFIVPLSKGDYNLNFFKSNKSNRWWIEVPVNNSKSKYERHHIVPCSYEHYQVACKDEMPDIWWKTYQKLN